MGIATLPTASSSGGLPTGVGSVVASGFASLGYSTFSLPAGNYVVYAYANQSAATYISAPSNNILISRPISLAQNSSGYQTIKLTTTETSFTLASQQSMLYGTIQYLSPNTLTRLNDFYANGGYFVIAGYNSTTNYLSLGSLSNIYNAVSNNTNQLTQTSVFGTTSNNAVCWINTTGTVVLAGQLALLSTSTNSGVTWVTRTVTGVTGNFQAFTYGSANGYYVGVIGATSNNIVSSTDAVTWVTRASANTAGIYCVAYGNSTFVAAGVSGSVSSSTDSITWSSRTTPQTTYSYRSIAYGAGVFVTVASATSVGGGAVPNVAVSTNGTTWTGVTLAFSGNYANPVDRDSLTFANNLFWFRDSQNSNIFVSTNGTTWTGWYDYQAESVATDYIYTKLYSTNFGLTGYYNGQTNFGFTTLTPLTYAVYNNTNTAIN